MANSIKQFGLGGIGSDVQIGKSGPRIVNTGGNLEVKDTADAYKNVRGADAVIADDLITYRQHQMLEDIVNKLVPDQPPMFPNGTFAQSGYTTGSSPVLAAGAIADNTNGGTIPVTTAGASVSAFRGTSGTVDSTTLTENGPGDSGSIQLFVNNTLTQALAFTATTGDTINTNGLQVTNNGDFPDTTPGFFQDFDAKVNDATAIVGWNRYRLNHTALGAGSTADLYILRDTLTAAPVTAGGAVSESAPGTAVLSSGVPHYGNDASIAISGLTMTNLAGFTYRNSNPMVIGDNSSGEDSILNGTVERSYADLGIVTPIAANTTAATALSTVTVTPTQNNAHGEGQLTVLTRNVNGNSNTITLAPSILHMAGNTTRVNENSIVTPGTRDHRVYLGAGATTDTPAGPLPASPTAWNSSQLLTAAGFEHEAVVAGGILRADRRNYTTGVLPAGPNYTSKTASQYFTLSFRVAARSNIAININGSYAGLWVAMPGVSDNSSVSPNALGGAWWNAGALYNGAGVPGRAGDTAAGCANGAVASGSTGTVNVTFGTESSTNATNNRIYVRVKLNAGQSINSIQVS